MGGFLEQSFLSRREGQKQCPRPAGNRSEVVAAIERDGLIVLGIDHQHESCYISFDNSCGGIGQHRFTEAPPLKPPIHSQPATAYGGHCRISWQAFGIFRRKVNQRDTRCRQRVIWSDVTSSGFDRHEAIGDAAPNVLGHLRLEVPVKSFLSAIE